jgi:hypothetical protein
MRPIYVADGVKVRRFQLVTRSGPRAASGNTSPERRTVAKYSPRIGARNPGSTTDRDAGGVSGRPSLHEGHSRRSASRSRSTVGAPARPSSVG